KAFNVLAARTLGDVKRRTRMGMGECQAQMCAYRVADLMAESFGFGADEALNMLSDFLREQWKISRVLEGSQKAQTEFFKTMYRLAGSLDG
ncbi:MAG: (2Fe-2S)-binding protein, partial [Candidatus Jordarchaeales archaeon]